MSAFTIPPVARRQLTALTLAAEPGLEAFYAANHDRLRAEASDAIAGDGMLAPICVFDAALDARPDATVPRGVFRRGLLARFALDLPETVAALDLPPCILSLYPELTERLARTIPDDDADPVDGHARDVAHVTGLFLPALAQDLDLCGRLDRRMLLSAVVRRGRLSLIGRWLLNRLDRCFIEFHTDSRHLTHFTEEGRVATLLCAAELLRRRPALAGVVGVSWYYDPVVARISPRLAYLQALPLSEGAFLIRNAPGEVHTQRATMTSATRRRLYEEGKYLPTCYTMIWPRRALLSWARRRLASTGNDSPRGEMSLRGTPARGHVGSGKLRPRSA